MSLTIQNYWKKVNRKCTQNAVKSVEALHYIQKQRAVIQDYIVMIVANGYKVK